MGESGRMARAVGWLAAAGGSAAPGELGAALGVGHTTQAKVTAELLSAGLATRDSNRVTLTPAGWARTGAADGAGAGSVLDAAAAGWPYAHRAFLELMCSAVIARRHLAEVRPRGHLGFMAIGETGTGKSSVVLLACHLFGLDGAAVQRFLYSETSGSLLGRREQDGEGFRLMPSEAAGLPLLLLDEFDKGEEAVRRAGWAFFQGEPVVRHEGQTWPVCPVPTLAANPSSPGDRYRLLRPEYRRRAVVLDTGYMRGRGHEIEDVLTAYFRGARPGALCLDRLAPPAGRLDDRGLAVLRSVRNVLTDAGREEFPGVEALELATLGRLALMGSGDHALAAFATTLAYLQVTETMPGQVAEGWQPDMRALRGQLGEHAEALAATVERGRTGRELAIRDARTAVVQREMLSDELTVARDELAERLRLAAAAIAGRQLAGLTDDQKAKAAGVHGALAKIGRETSQCRSAERLAELTTRAERALDAARQIAAYLAAERDRRDRARSATALQRQQDAADRQRDRAVRQAQARAQRAQLGQVTAAARELERLYRRTTTRPAESPLAVLATRTADGDPLITYQPRPQPPTRSGLRRLVTRPTPAGDWHVPGTAVSFPGRPGYCAALASWGPGTRAVLRPWLAALHTKEDHLCAVLGRQPRKRPAL